MYLEYLNKDNEDIFRIFKFRCISNILIKLYFEYLYEDVFRIFK